MGGEEPAPYGGRRLSAQRCASAGYAARQAAATHPPRPSGRLLQARRKVRGILARGPRVAGVTDALLDLVENSLGQCVENILHILACEGASFEEENVLLLRKPARLEKGDLALLLQVPFVADGNDGNVLPGLLSCILQPRRQIVVGVPRSDIVQDEGSHRAAVVRSRHRSISLLSSSVPNLKLDLSVAQRYDFGTEFDPNCVCRLLPKLPL
mmetsp:Transcript_14062/g.30540  ORF Transcript_14062/g.30540 Transcript_14062/m.30540 type:complete len:211 (-) Transcript_14062:268-900(-)